MCWIMTTIYCVYLNAPVKCKKTSSAIFEAPTVSRNSDSKADRNNTWRCCGNQHYRVKFFGRKTKEKVIEKQTCKSHTAPVLFIISKLKFRHWQSIWTNALCFHQHTSLERGIYGRSNSFSEKLWWSSMPFNKCIRTKSSLHSKNSLTDVLCQKPILIFQNNQLLPPRKASRMPHCFLNDMTNSFQFFLCVGSPLKCHAALEATYVKFHN